MEKKHGSTPCNVSSVSADLHLSASIPRRLAFSVCAAVSLKDRWLDIAPYIHSRLDMHLRRLANSDLTGLGLELALTLDTPAWEIFLHSYVTARYQYASQLF